MSECIKVMSHKLCDLCIMHFLPGGQTILGRGERLDDTESGEDHASNVQFHISKTAIWKVGSSIPNVSLDVDWSHSRNMKCQKQECLNSNSIGSTTLECKIWFPVQPH